MSSVLKRFIESLRRDNIYAVSLRRHAATGEKPAISFKKQIEVYNKDAAVRDFVDVLAMQAVGMGFYTSCDEEYERAGEAKDIVDEFNQRNNVDALLQVTAREIVGTGNGVWQLFEPDKVKRLMRVPIETFDKVLTNEYLAFQETQWTKKNKLKLGYYQTSTYGGNFIPHENLLHFRLNPIDTTGWGCGVLRVLLEKYSWQEYDSNISKHVTRTRPSLMEIKAKLDLDLIEIFEKFAGPVEAWISDNKKLAEALKAELVKTPKYGGRVIAGGGKVDIKTPPLAPQTRYQAYVDYLWNQFCLAGQTPLPKLFTTPGFTEASANAAIDIADRLIMPIQRFIKRDLEMLWRKVIHSKDSSINPVKAAVRLNWGAPETPEIEIADILRAKEIDVITREEARKNLIKAGFELLQESESSKEA
jgi:hypothetical protein